MAKKLYTSQDIIQLVNDQNCYTLVVNKGDIVTPMAHDTARDLGVKIVDAGTIPAQVSSPTAETKPASTASSNSELEARVRNIIASLLGTSEDDKPVAVATPVLHVDCRNLTMPPFPFDVKRPEMDVRLEDVVTAEHGAPMAAGFLSMHKGSFPWTLTYDEIQYVVEGELHIITPQGTCVGKPGDVLYIPKNTSIQFSTPSWAKFFYVTYPAEWSG